MDARQVDALTYHEWAIYRRWIDEYCAARQKTG
jgi:hypothetical protein